MTWFRCGGSGIPAALKNRMNAVLNKKFGTAVDYPPNGWPNDVNLMGVLPEGTATGSIAHITDGADEVPIKSWQVTLPASLDGYSEVNGTQTGKNLANGLYEYSVRNMIISPVFLRGGTVYTVSFTRGVNVQYIYIRKGDTVSLVGDAYATGSNATSFSFTADEDAYYYAQLYRTNTSATWADYPVSNPQIEVGSTATTYEPYTAPTVSTVNLGRTIYGGTADVVNGTGSEGYNKITLSSNLNGLTMTQIGTTGVYRIRFSLADAKGAINSAVFNGLCDYYTPLSANQTYNKNDGISINTSGQCYIYDSRFNTSTSLNDFKTWIDANPVNLCYELATGTDFTFTPITPKPETALGVNNFWADEGDTEVTYRADINLALQALSGSRGLMMASRPVTQMAGEESDSDQVNELVEDNETEQEDINDAR